MIYMKNDDYPYDFYIPKTFSIGISTSKSNAGFPSMKMPDGKWTSPSVFEKICGFKPWTQRNEEKEINKALNQAVEVTDNVPTSGFKIVDISKNVYDSKTTIFNQMMCATIQDPRGWMVSVSQRDLQHFLEASNFNVINGEIAGVKLMYAWNKRGGFQLFKLVVADEEALEMQQATDSLFTKKTNVKYIKPKDFVVGKVYSSSNSKIAGHKYMYMGIHDVYSCTLHENAFSTGRYDIDKFLNDRCDATSKDMHVFYCIDFKKNDLCTYGGLGRNAGSQPYFVTKNVSKLFENADDKVEDGFTMHNSALPVKYETVVDDMSKSAMFNLIDLSVKHLTNLCWPTFEDLVNGFTYGSSEYYECKLKTYPFDASYRKITMHCDEHAYKESLRSSFGFFGSTLAKTFKSFCMSTAYSEDKYLVKEPSEQTYYNSKVYLEYPFTQANRKEVLRNLYDELKPKIFQYKFMNGNDVPMHQCASLNDSSIMK